ncbi:DUF4956 domain-containing protein [Paenibacillus thermotolerans]|uniref:DUF4956 domain-containing protein n=1 Tax=Paenibacillus thermotolerans TaxID=3027807 RepID=UPI0023686316|nr:MULTISPECIES: DUF4956 domain-containing protein [unclassified Paenibacillus]
MLTDWMNNIGQFTVVSLTEALIAIVLSFVLGLVITQVYKLTFRGRGYSQSFVHTIIIMSVVVSVIMIVIGSNVAVAFGLVGAFSIIRFRTAMSNPKDIAFIFFGMGSGIACGLGFYVLAVLFTIALCVLIYVLFVLDYGKKTSDEKTLKITVPENFYYENAFNDVFDQYLRSYSLVSVETTNLGTMFQLEYVVVGKDGSSDKELIDAIRVKNANMKVSLVMTQYST